MVEWSERRPAAFLPVKSIQWTDLSRERAEHERGAMLLT
jgi:hypothetical protein